MDDVWEITSPDFQTFLVSEGLGGSRRLNYIEIMRCAITSVSELWVFEKISPGEWPFHL